jgi:2-polyprenyl-6-methoxyphenol hydroxylase-like FAD-dependent oxidoreductase
MMSPAFSLHICAGKHIKGGCHAHSRQRRGGGAKEKRWAASHLVKIKAAQKEAHNFHLLCLSFTKMPSKLSNEDSRRKIRIAIIGSGMSGLALANGLLNDQSDRFEVNVYERDGKAFDLERGGYQLRMALGGVEALKNVTDLPTWNDLQQAWGGDGAKAPSMVDPKSLKMYLKLSDVKIYPKSRPIARSDLKRVLLQKPSMENVIHFGHCFERYELIPSEDNNGQHQVLIHFKDAASNPPVTADFIVAADGSNSRINQQAGINNKIKLSSWALFQSRGPISQSQFDKLPSSLLSQGSNLYLAGTDYSGFAAVYYDPLMDSDAERTYQLFWSALVPKEKGESIIERSGNDKMQIVNYLADYVTQDLNFDPLGLPYLFKSATEHLRTGTVTSSYKPTNDWRQGKAANARVIIMGDAMHPMTPGRGMGANQALMDAGNLSNLLKSTTFSSQGPTDEELQRLVKSFDAEMYERAFQMVKASEDMSGLDLSTTKGKVMITIGKIVLFTIGYIVSALEFLGLKQPQEISFVHPHEK